MTGEEIIDLYMKDKKMKEFAEIIKDSPVFPIITDSENRILSMPPLINSDHSKIKLDTKNVFIEITATDETKANIALNIMVSMFSQYCAKPFEAEQIEIVYDSKSIITPDLSTRDMDIDVNYANTICGIKEEPETMVRLFRKMGLHSKVKDSNTLTV